MKKRTIKELRELFAIFCDPAQDLARSNYDLSHPFTRDGFLAATDGRVCVRAPSMETERGIFPPVLALRWGRERYSDNPIPLPAVKEPRWIKCPKCRGQYKRHSCTVCNDSGTSCKQFKEPVSIGDAATLARGYVWKLRRVGISEVFVSLDRPEFNPVYFVGAGFEGLLQPMCNSSSIRGSDNAAEVPRGKRRWRMTIMTQKAREEYEKAYLHVMVCEEQLCLLKLRAEAIEIDRARAHADYLTAVDARRIAREKLPTVEEDRLL